MNDKPSPTIQNQAEIAKQNAAIDYRAIFDHANDGIFIYDPVSEKILDVNAKGCEMFGYAADEMIGLNVRALSMTHYPYRPEDIIHWVRKVAREGPQVFEWRARSRDGGTLWVELNLKRVAIGEREQILAIVRDISVRKAVEDKLAREKTFSDFTNGRPHLIGMGVDISDRKKTEKEKTELERQLQHAMKIEAIGTLAGGIAHDFNNILGAIMGYTELARFEAPKESLLETYLLQVLKASQRAKGLVEQILIFSRQGEIQPRPLKLKPIIEEALKLLRASIPATIEIIIDINKDSGAVMADPTQIHQVLMNLCTNAAHSMLARGGVLTIRLENILLENTDPILASHPDLKPGKFLQLAVSDTGHGISPLIIDRIFEPYFTTKEKGVGTGLGLSAVHGIVQRCGGAVAVKSRMGLGTAFYVLLPRINLDVEDRAAVIPPAQGARERILLIDDEPMLADLGHRMIERLGYQVVSKTSSLEALECFRNDPGGFDVVVTDQTMPHLTGEGLARELLRLRPEIPIIICTGYSETMDNQKALETGIRKLLAKPMIMGELAEAIRQALNK